MVVSKQIVPAMVCSALIVSKGIIVNHVVKSTIVGVCHHAYVRGIYAGIISAMVVPTQIIGKKKKKERNN